MAIPDCDKCLLQDQLDKCCYYNCLSAGREIARLPTLQEQLIELYQPIFDVEWGKFLMAIKHGDIPVLTEGQRLKIFRHHYKELEGVKQLDITETKAVKKQKQGVELW